MMLAPVVILLVAGIVACYRSRRRRALKDILEVSRSATLLLKGERAVDGDLVTVFSDLELFQVAYEEQTFVQMALRVTFIAFPTVLRRFQGLPLRRPRRPGRRQGGREQAVLSVLG